MTFQEIRKQYPSQFLVLVEPEEKRHSVNQIEVVGAQEVFAYESGEEMMEAYRSMKKKGMQVKFCTPHYKNRFVVEQILTGRIFSS